MAFSIFRLGRQCLKYRYLTCRWMPLLRSPSELSCANITTCDPLPAYPCRAALRIAQLAIVHSHAFWELVVWDNWVDSTDRYRTAKLVMAKMS
ncbi:MAG: hypothetical protein GDA56_29535 [Hormoscilla sp. GM7CHS1pb]|nr:hypothetical protein [Hormoscilla sp. GM7CHS1pb]